MHKRARPAPLTLEDDAVWNHFCLRFPESFAWVTHSFQSDRADADLMYIAAEDRRWCLTAIIVETQDFKGWVDVGGFHV